MNKKQKFYPDYLFEITVVIFLTLEILVSLALLHPTGLGKIINFTVPYQPKPEWYFLWLYQLVKYFHGHFICIGTVVIPLIWISLLLFLPWIDKGKYSKIKAWCVAFTLFFFIFILTVISLKG